jgi:hypothetical protein
MLRLPLLVLMLVAGAAACASGRASGRPDAAQATGSAAFYANPVLHGDYPDPSVIRVGNDVAVGADLPAPPFDRPRGMAPRWGRLPDAALLVRR